MISVAIKIRGLDGLRECYSAVEQATLASAQISAEHALGQQLAQHLGGRDPRGLGQRPNTPGVQAAKERARVTPNVPLRVTGEFMLRSSWKVHYDAKRKRVRVGPYGRRARYIADAVRARGFRLLPDGLPEASLTVGRTWLQRRLDLISRRRSAR